MFIFPNLCSHARNLVGIYDCVKILQSNKLISSSFFHIRSIAKITTFLPFFWRSRDHAFITSRLDCCNSLLIWESSVARLQLIQKATARLLIGTKKRDHISPVLASFHWLTMTYRTNFKIVLFVFKAVHGLAPDYISDLLRPCSTSRSLRSSDQLLLTIPLLENLCQTIKKRWKLSAGGARWKVKGSPLGFISLCTIDICRKCHGKPSNSCWDISLWTKAVDWPTLSSREYYCNGKGAMLEPCIAIG